jgi:uncharacterized membrane protein
MEPNVLYYLFSTCAQMLATSFGVLAAICISHSASIHKMTQERMTEMESFLPASFTERLTWYYRILDGDLSAFLNWFDTTHFNLTQSDIQKLMTLALGLCEYGHIQRRVRIRLLIALCLTVATIFLSLAGLVVSRYLVASTSTAYTYLALLALLIAFSIASYIKLALSVDMPRGTGKAEDEFRRWAEAKESTQPASTTPH